MSDWFYGKGGMKYGPIDEATLRSRIATGEIAPQDFVWRDGMESWEPVQEVRDLYSKEAGVPDSLDGNGSPEEPSSISQDFSTPPSPQTPDDEKVVWWEPHMMRSVGPRAKWFIFGTKWGKVVVTNRRFLFLSEGESGFSGQFSRNVQEIDSQYLDSESSIDIPIGQIERIRVRRRWDFASYISIQGVDANMRKVSYAFMSKFGMNRSKLYELVNAAKKSR
jgi:hypothetical protein